MTITHHVTIEIKTTDGETLPVPKTYMIDP